MNDEHIREIVKKMPNLVDPSVITDAVNDYLDEHPVSGIDAEDEQKLALVTFDGAVENFIIPSECRDNWKPSEVAKTSSYDEGEDATGYYCSNLMESKANGTYFKISLTEIPSYWRVMYYDDDRKFRGKDAANVVVDTDGFLKIQMTTNFKYFRLQTRNAIDWDNLVVCTLDKFGQQNTSIENLVISDKTITNSGATPNILKGKKWAVCGDSFSAGTAIEETIQDGIYKGYKPTYQYLIANRNAMKIQPLFVGGRTIAKPQDDSFTNCLANYYTTIDADADYITIYLGLNDSNHSGSGSSSEYGEDTTGEIPLGTISDNTVNTFYGAWNVILDWLIVNRPNAKIGIIVPTGCRTDDYRLAVIECAKKHGVPYIDLNGDERTPAMIHTTNPNISGTVKTALINKWRVSESNAHPNAQAHAYESTFIENFLRSL